MSRLVLWSLALMLGIGIAALDQPIGAAGCLAAAEVLDDEDVAELGALPGIDDEQDATPSPEAQTRRINDAFDQRVFGGLGADAIAAARARLASTLLQKIASLDATCQLTREQQNKLELAGRGDIQRLLNRIEKLRNQFQIIYRDEEDVASLKSLDPQTRQSWDAIFADPFGETSLFARSRRKNLTSEQAAKFSRPPSDNAETAGDNHPADPREILMRGVIFAVDHRKLRRHDPRLDEILGRDRVSVVTHEIEQTVTWGALCREGAIEIISRSVVRSSDRGGAGVGIGVSFREDLSQMYQWMAYTTIEVHDRIRFKTTQGIETHRSGALLLEQSTPAIGPIHGSATSGPGEHVVIRQFWMPIHNATNGAAETDDQEPEPLTEPALTAGRKRELIVILSPEIIAPK